MLYYCCTYFRLWKQREAKEFASSTPTSKCGSQNPSLGSFILGSAFNRYVKKWQEANYAKI